MGSFWWVMVVLAQTPVPPEPQSAPAAPPESAPASQPESAPPPLDSASQPQSGPAPTLAMPTVAIPTHHPLGLERLLTGQLALLRLKLGVVITAPAAVEPAVPAFRQAVLREVAWQRQNMEVAFQPTAVGPVSDTAAQGFLKSQRLDLLLLVRLAEPLPNGAVRATALMWDARGNQAQVDGGVVAALVPPEDPRVAQAQQREQFFQQAWLVALDPQEGLVLLTGDLKAVADDALPLDDAHVAQEFSVVTRDRRLNTLLGVAACALPFAVAPACAAPALVGAAALVTVGFVLSAATWWVGALAGGAAAAGGLVWGCLWGCAAGSAAGVANRVVGLVLLPARRMTLLQAAQGVHNRAVAASLGVTTDLLPTAYFP